MVADGDATEEQPVPVPHRPDLMGSPPVAQWPWRHSILVAVIVGLFLYVALRNLADVAGGADSSGYLNLATWLERGELLQTTPDLERFDLTGPDMPLLVPLGLQRGRRPRQIVAYYPIGLPVQMAALKWLVRSDRGRFLVAPFAGALGLLVFYVLARQLGLPRSYALSGVAMLAVTPTYLLYSLQPMSDVVATFWGLLAFTTAFAARRHLAWTVMAGFAFAMGVLVRPTNILLLPALLIATPLNLRAYVLLGLGGVPLAACLLAFNAVSYGSVLATGYGEAWRTETAWSYFPDRVEHYVGWLSTLLTPWVPLSLVVLPFAGGVPRRNRWFLLTWFLPLFVFYCTYYPYAEWWYTRFLLPVLPALILASLLVTRDILERVRDKADWFWAPTAAHADRARLIRGAGFGLLAMVVLTGLYQISLRNVLEIDDNERAYREACLWAKEHLPAKAAVLAMQTSGALEYYTDFVIVRWDQLDSRRFERVDRRVASQGYEWFALLFPHEAERVRRLVTGKLDQVATFGPITLFRLIRDESSAELGGA